VAHNTFVQFAAEDGLFAGLMYLLLCLGVFSSYLKQLRIGREQSVDPFIVSLNEAITASLGGFFVCSMFLDLATFEMFYYLLVLDVAKNRLIQIESENPSTEFIKAEALT
jgi:hypothetical protein